MRPLTLASASVPAKQSRTEKKAMRRHNVLCEVNILKLPY
jgi:hypothetical protein